MSGRYKAVPETTNNRRLVYVVIDTLTGEWMHVYDCFLWAEHKAEEMKEDIKNEQKDCCNIDGGDYLERLS